MNTRPSRMSRDDFMRRFGDLYEASPWVAERVHDRGLEPRHDAPAHLHEAFRAVVLAAGTQAQLALLREHPPLATAARGLSDDSRREQSGAGLDRCSEAELAAFRELNEAYLARFGFPFIIAVRGRSRSEILETLRQRIGGQPEEELREALEQVCEIGRLRLQERLDG